MNIALEVFGITVQEAARLLGVSASHVYRLASTDETFPKQRKVGRATRFDPRELREWFDAQVVARKPRRPISIQRIGRAQHVPRRDHEVNQS